MEDDPAPGEWDRDAVVGPRHPARREARDQRGQIAGVERECLREGVACRSRKRLDLPCLGPVSTGPQRIERVGQGVADLAGVHQLAQQHVDQAGEGEPVRQAAGAPIAVPMVAGAPVGAPVAVPVAAELVVGSQQLPRSEEEGRCVLAPRRDDVVCGVLQPGPQPARQAGIEAGPSRRVAAQQRQDLGPRATIRHSIARRCSPEQGAWCDEDHRRSVPTGCDIPRTPLP